MKWGLYDTVDLCWLGDEHGPKLFDEGDPLYKGERDSCHLVARLAAEMADIQMGHRPHHTIARPYDGTGTKFKDEIPLKRTMEEAMRGKMSGKFL